MIFSSRAGAAIEILETVLNGTIAETAISRWSRSSRYAGSKDRAAVRDIVFGCLRKKRSLLWSFRDANPEFWARKLVLSYLSYSCSVDYLCLNFNGKKYSPHPLDNNEINTLKKMNLLVKSAPSAVVLNFPDFLQNELLRSLGEKFFPIMMEMQSRAPVDIRVNLLKSNLGLAQKKLAKEGIVTQPLLQSKSGLRISAMGTKVHLSGAYLNGDIELQDVSSQMACTMAGVAPGMKVLDYCAGGGGKALALGSDLAGTGNLFAYDINQKRMLQLKKRASRAGLKVNVLTEKKIALAVSDFDVVFVDAPCSGTGTWRRNPDIKWRFDQSMLEKIKLSQAKIILEAQHFVKKGGRLVYVTCSFLLSEGVDQIELFLLSAPNFKKITESFLDPVKDGDGFYIAVLEKI